jgi:hypothetical protein
MSSRVPTKTHQRRCEEPDIPDEQSKRVLRVQPCNHRHVAIVRRQAGSKPMGAASPGSTACAGALPPCLHIDEALGRATVNVDEARHSPKVQPAVNAAVHVPSIKSNAVSAGARPCCAKQACCGDPQSAGQGTPLVFTPVDSDPTGQAPKHFDSTCSVKGPSACPVKGTRPTTLRGSLECWLVERSCLSRCQSTTATDSALTGHPRQR